MRTGSNFHNLSPATIAHRLRYFAPGPEENLTTSLRRIGGRVCGDASHGSSEIAVSRHSDGKFTVHLHPTSSITQDNFDAALALALLNYSEPASSTSQLLMYDFSGQKSAENERLRDFAFELLTPEAIFIDEFRSTGGNISTLANCFRISQNAVQSRINKLVSKGLIGAQEVLDDGYDDFLIVDLRKVWNNRPYVSFWKPDDKGYTYGLGYAGSYTRDQVTGHMAYYVDRENGRYYSRFPVARRYVEAGCIDPDPRYSDKGCGAVLPNTGAIRSLLRTMRPKWAVATRTDD